MLLDFLPLIHAGPQAPPEPQAPDTGADSFQQKRLAGNFMKDGYVGRQTHRRWSMPARMAAITYDALAPSPSQKNNSVLSKMAREMHVVGI